MTRPIHFAFTLAILYLTIQQSLAGSSSIVTFEGELLATSELIPEALTAKTPLQIIQTNMGNADFGTGFEETFSTEEVNSASTGVFMTGITVMKSMEELVTGFQFSWSDGTTSSEGGACQACLMTSFPFNTNDASTWATETVFSSVTYSYGRYSGADGYAVYDVTMYDSSGNAYTVFNLAQLEKKVSSKTSKTVSLGETKLYGVKFTYYSTPTPGLFYDMAVEQLAFAYTSYLGAMDFSDVVLDFDSATTEVTGISGYQSGSVNNCNGSESQSITPSFSYQLSSQSSYTESSSVQNSYSSSDSTTQSISVSYKVGVEIEGLYSQELEVGATNKVSYSETTSTSNSYTYGNTESQTTTTTVSNSATVTASAGHDVDWEFYIYQVSVTVPSSGKVKLVYANGDMESKQVTSTYTLQQQYASTLIIKTDSSC